MRLHLFPEPLQRLSVELFHFAATQADDVRMLLLGTRLVVMLVALEVHQVQLIHELSFFEHLQSSVDGNAVDPGILLLRKLVELLGIEVAAGLIDEFEQNAPLPGDTNPLFLEGTLHAFR